MNYFIKRELQEYGPYSLAELQRYVGTGNILLTDLCRSEGMDQWIPVSQVIGNIAVPVAAPAPAPVAYAVPQPSPYPPPPSLHWGIVLTLHIITCSLFSWVWIFVQAAWLKKVQDSSKGILYFAGGVALLLIMFFGGFAIGLAGALGREDGGATLIALTLLGRLALLVLVILGSFNMKSSIEEHYNTAEPIGLTLNGGLTFLFAFFFLSTIYFQYHFNRINDWKRSQGQIF